VREIVACLGHMPRKRGAVNKSTQHHLIESSSLEVVLNGVSETVWFFCGGEEQDLEAMEGRTVDT
jgi:hypothetical protein